MAVVVVVVVLLLMVVAMSLYRVWSVVDVDMSLSQMFSGKRFEVEAESTRARWPRFRTFSHTERLVDCCSMGDNKGIRQAILSGFIACQYEHKDVYCYSNTVQRPSDWDEFSARKRSKSLKNMGNMHQKGWMTSRCANPI